MDYSNELLTRIRDLSSQLTPPQEISALLDIEEREFLNDLNTIGHPARKAFMQGYATTANEIRKDNINLAQAGSPAADEACRGYLRCMMRDIYT